MGVIVIIITVICILVLSYFATAGLFWLICWGFGMTFSWKIATAVWAIIFILGSIFRGGKGGTS